MRSANHSFRLKGPRYQQPYKRSTARCSLKTWLADILGAKAERGKKSNPPLRGRRTLPRRRWMSPPYPFSSNASGKWPGCLCPRQREAGGWLKVAGWRHGRCGLRAPDRDTGPQRWIGKPLDFTFPAFDPNNVLRNITFRLFRDLDTGTAPPAKDSLEVLARGGGAAPDLAL